MKEITPAGLKEKLDNNEEIQLIDVREVHEHDMANIGGELMPMKTVLENADKISKDKPVILYCRSGNRSTAIITELEKRFGYTNLYNLQGGILAWARDVDDTLMIF